MKASFQLCTNYLFVFALFASFCRTAGRSPLELGGAPLRETEDRDGRKEPAAKLKGHVTSILGGVPFKCSRAQAKRNER